MSTNSQPKMSNAPTVMQASMPHGVIHIRKIALEHDASSIAEVQVNLAVSSDIVPKLVVLFYTRKFGDLLAKLLEKKDTEDLLAALELIS